MHVQGTETYCAPERSRTADLRKADVWSVGCVLYELFSGGERLFSWRTEQAKFGDLQKIWTGAWEPPRLPAAAAGWQPVVDAALKADPSERCDAAALLRLGNFACAPPCTSPSCQWHRSVRTRTLLQMDRAWHACRPAVGGAVHLAGRTWLA